METRNEVTPKLRSYQSWSIKVGKVNQPNAAQEKGWSKKQMPNTK